MDYLNIPAGNSIIRNRRSRSIFNDKEFKNFYFLERISLLNPNREINLLSIILTLRD
jgi:hypothetical protein